MQRPGLKTIILLSVLVIIFIIINRGCGKSSTKELIYEKVTKGTVKKTISVTGELEYSESGYDTQ